MFRQLINHNDDLRRLADKGYAVAFDSNYLVIRDVPYLDSDRKLAIGAIVTKVVFTDQDHIIQEDHQIFFAGSSPYQQDGTPIPNLGGGPTQLALSEACKDVVVQRSFSNKPVPTGKFEDFFHKIESYVSIISGPAMARYDVTPYTHRLVEAMPTDSVFKFRDTLTSRAEITDLAAKFKDDVVAIIGLGGTGAYVLDFLVKTPVREIRAFDSDQYYIHNAYRSPGKLEEAELNTPKAEVYHRRYDNFRKGLFIQNKYIDESSRVDLEGVTFAFVCVDKGPARAVIFDLLLSMHIPFIDVGMGPQRRGSALAGLVRMTYYSAERGQEVLNRGLANLVETPDDIYQTNIQISELNALNACLAVIRYKQVRGFYYEEEAPYHLLFDIVDMKIASATFDTGNGN